MLDAVDAFADVGAEGLQQVADHVAGAGGADDAQGSAAAEDPGAQDEGWQAADVVGVQVGQEDDVEGAGREAVDQEPVVGGGCLGDGAHDAFARIDQVGVAAGDDSARRAVAEGVGARGARAQGDQQGVALGILREHARLARIDADFFGAEAVQGRGGVIAHGEPQSWRWYGSPRAAGGVALPIKATRVTMVSR